MSDFSLQKKDSSDVSEPLLVSTESVNNSSYTSQSIFSKWRRLFLRFTAVLLLGTVFFLVATLTKVEVTSTSSTGTDVLTPSNDMIMLSASSSSWNSFLACSEFQWSFENDLFDGDSIAPKQGKSVSLHVFSEESPYQPKVSSASVSCHNMFGSETGTSKSLHIFSAAYSNASFNLKNDEDIITCPESQLLEGDLILNSTLTENIFVDTILYGANCNGFIVKVMGINSSASSSDLIIHYSIANVSLQDIFSSLSLSPTTIPYGTLTIPDDKVSLSLPLSSTYNLLDKENWRLSFSGGPNNLYSGYVLFSEIKWNVDSSLQELTYETGKFKGLTWRASSTMLLNGEFALDVNTAGFITIVIPLFTVNSPPEVIPVPVLEFITLNTELDLSLRLSISVDQLTSLYSMLWSYQASIAFEWEITCSKDLSSICSSKVIQADVTFMTNPVGTINTDVDEDTSGLSVSVNAGLGLGLGLQFDELLALKDELTLNFAVIAPSGSAVNCPQMTLQFNDGIGLNLRFFTIDLLPVFTFPIYEGDVMLVSSTATCVPTLAPTLPPTDGTIVNHLYYNAWYDEASSSGFGSYHCFCANGEVHSSCSSCSTNQYWYYWTQYTTLQTTTMNGVGTFDYNVADYYDDLYNTPPLIYHMYLNLEDDLMYGTGYEYFGPDTDFPSGHAQPETPYLFCRSLTNVYDVTEFDDCLYASAKMRYGTKIAREDVVRSKRKNSNHLHPCTSSLISNPNDDYN